MFFTFTLSSLALYLCLSIQSSSLPFPTVVGQQLTQLFRLSFQLDCSSFFFHNARYPLAVVDHKILRECLQTPTSCNVAHPTLSICESRSTGSRCHSLSSPSSTALPRALSSPFSSPLTTLGGHLPQLLLTMHTSTLLRLSSTRGVMAYTVSRCAAKFLSQVESQIPATISTPRVSQSPFRSQLVSCLQTLLSAIQVIHRCVLGFIPLCWLVTFCGRLASPD
jgi:hypothetical protein